MLANEAKGSLVGQVEDNEGSQAKWDAVPMEEIAAYSELQGRRQASWSQVAPVALGGLLLLPVGFFVGQWVVPAELGGPMFLIAVATACVLGAVAIYKYQKINPLIGERDRALFEGFGEGRRSLVQMTIRQKGVVTGVDRGVIWVEDRMLIFAGHHTSFALGGYYDIGFERFRHDPLVGDPTAGILLKLRKEADLEVGLEFQCIPDGSLPGALLRLSDAFDLWKRTKNYKVKGQFPPTELGPGTLTVAATRIQVYVQCFAIWVAVGGLGWLGFNLASYVAQRWWVASDLGVLVLIGVLIGHHRSLVSQLRQRMRFEKQRLTHG